MYSHSGGQDVIMNNIIYYIISALTGYLLGSVPFALVIGKAFYKTDIRQHGSGNLGGSNAGRVLGKKAGIAVMILDILKVTLAMLLVSLFTEGEICLIIAGLFSAVGHCFPVFARFHGGKAVATMYGFLFGMITVGGMNPLVFFIPLFFIPRSHFYNEDSFRFQYRIFPCGSHIYSVFRGFPRPHLIPCIFRRSFNSSSHPQYKKTSSRRRK
jgi:acyl-phosphate glycerol 3-phosphate acyltransferase